MTAPTLAARGCQTGPSWCINHRGDMCNGEVHVHGSVYAWLMQDNHERAEIAGPVIYVDGHMVPAKDAAAWARTFALLDDPDGPGRAAEVAATVRRLGELAVAS